jgi:hypothetical protein
MYENMAVPKIKMMTQKTLSTSALAFLSPNPTVDNDVIEK